MFKNYRRLYHAKLFSKYNLNGDWVPSPVYLVFEEHNKETEFLNAPNDTYLNIINAEEFYASEFLGHINRHFGKIFVISLNTKMEFVSKNEFFK